MSVSETEKECPLCMEALDWDDLGFFPCSCGYQICRFCWHRLRTDENGLCPACRQAFPDIPVSFNPEVSAEELKKQKKRNKERRSNKDQVFKPQDLATLRVVQKNLVFVIGLSSRLTQEDLKKEFAHFGKIIKFVHNKSTAYITYSKPEEAIRAIRTLNASAAHETAVQNLQLQSQLTNGTSAITLIPATTTPANLQQTANNSIINNNVAGLNSANFFLNAMSVPVPPNRLKASLGTTKYCNHFLRSQQCPKVGECMYLHEIAEAEASFTKEQMQAGKHVEYEKKLMDSYLAKLDWQTVAMVRNANPPSTSIQVNPNKGLQLDQQQISQHQSQHQPPQIQQPQPQTQPQTQLQTQTQPQPHHHQLNHHQQQQQPQQQPQEPPQQYHDQNIISELSTQALQNQLQSQNQQSQIQFHQQKQQQQQQQQHLHKQLVSDTDSEDDGLDFDPISVSTSGLRDLLDQQVQQAKQMQMQTYLQQLNSNQSLANVFFQQNNRLNHPSTMTTTGTNGLISDNSFNSHTQTLQTLAGLNNSANQQQQALWQNLSAWTSFLQRSGYGFENSR